MRFAVKALALDTSQLRHLVVFIGNPRSGTTLLRSLLDAHPHAIVGNEVHILQHVVQGQTWQSVVARILQNASDFARRPTWTGHSYALPAPAGKTRGAIRLIGDKRAAKTLELLAEDKSSLFRLLDWSPVPVRFIHCVRHPFDVITTRTRQNRAGQPLAYHLERYFYLENAAAHLCRVLGDKQCKRVYQEQLIAEPDAVLRDALAFLALDAEETYLETCKSLIYERPRKSRFDLAWPDGAIAEVERQTLGCEHLSRYLEQGRLHFDG